MARYRPVNVSIWDDEDKFLTYNDSEKILFIYLITNKSCTESGIYKISPRIISSILEWKKEKFYKTIFKLYPNVYYHKETSTVFIKNFYRYNGATKGRPDLIEKSIISDTEIVTPLWHCFIETYPKFRKSIGKVLENYIEYEYEYEYENNNENEDKSKSDTKKREEKITYADYVSMSEVQYNKLVDEHGEKNALAAIKVLDNYKGSSGKKYKSDYHAIGNWVIGYLKEKQMYEVQYADGTLPF